MKLEDTVSISLRGSGAESCPLGCAPPSRLDKFLVSPAWETVQKVIRALARRSTLRHRREDLVADAEFRVLQHVHAGRDVERWVGFAAAVVRSVVRLQKRQQHPIGIQPGDLDLLACPEPRTSFDQLSSSPVPRIRLRGYLERGLALAIVEGMSCGEFARRNGLPEKEVRRIVIRMARNLGHPRPKISGGDTTP